MLRARPGTSLGRRATRGVGERSLGWEAGRNAHQVAENDSGMGLKAVASFS